MRHRLTARIPPAAKIRILSLARRMRLPVRRQSWWLEPNAPWRRRPPAGPGPDGVWCIVCGWTGEAFEGEAHVESNRCPRCGSIGRDRFVLWCWWSGGDDQRGARVLETSPRLGLPYRELMRNWFAYRGSDFDERAHLADVRIDLQRIDLPDASLDVVVSSHVLEHVPDTELALRELHRVLRPGGSLYLLVPLQQGRTAPPASPEFHDDHTPVFWRFGWDLTDRLRAVGFRTTVLVTEEMHAMLTGDDHPADRGEFALSELVPHPTPGDLHVVADRRTAARQGLLPAYQYVAWRCVRPPA